MGVLAGKLAGERVLATGVVELIILATESLVVEHVGSASQLSWSRAGQFVAIYWRQGCLKGGTLQYLRSILARRFTIGFVILKASTVCTSDLKMVPMVGSGR